MHVVAAPARETMPAGHQRMTNYAVANLDPFDTRADRFDPAGVLVAHDVWKLDVDLAAPDALNDVQIGATDAGTTDAHDHVHRARDLRVSYVIELDELLRRQLLVELMKHRRFH